MNKMGVKRLTVKVYWLFVEESRARRGNQYVPEDYVIVAQGKAQIKG